ncbi:hypothetical protein [Telmatospirillum siberiense]|uniref:Uncharacterized protein n=1 Tax=Telmatospirillum siberiense TaxID=382514 RepID=A0A2N3Q185_9PROT|nr:hypothetical protein [Telmatospirillum siberiense]PKU26407.1 hypothetical protein CWS72_00715 [Telmatospirillum siberiense]
MTPAACISAIPKSTGHSLRHPTALPPIPHSSLCTPDRFVGDHEPTLDELLDDPIMARLLACDGIDMRDLLTLVAKTRTALKRG